MAPDLRLVVNGVGYGGWKSIRVRRSLEEIAGCFELSVSDLWPTQSTPRDIRKGDRCVVTIDGTTVVTGFVDGTNPGFDARSHGDNVRGRDATADLVDCSAVHQHGEWRQARLDRIARDLAAPYGVTVTVDADIGAAFPLWAIQDGETIFACLERAARQRGVLLLSDGHGGLILGKAGTTRVGTDLVEGQNLLTCSANDDDTQRYQTYILKGQQTGDDDVSGEAASALKSTATDPGVTRPRTLVIMTEDEGDLAALTRRAHWEASVRAARARTVNVSVQGWKHRTGLWTPNTVVRLRAPRLKLEEDLLIRDVDLVTDERGSRADMVLTPAAAYSAEPMPPTKKARKRAEAELFE